MRKLTVFTLILGCLSILSCSEERMNSMGEPTIQVNLQIRNANEWKSANVTIDYIRFFQTNSDQSETGIGTVQNWNGTTLNFDLRQEETKKVLEKPYWEAILLGIDPDFIETSFVTVDDIQIEGVAIEYVEYIPFENQTTIKNGKKYQIDLGIDLDKALIKKEDSFELKVSTIKAKISEL
uniref:Uncharacterized protein n=1 Tax=Roseihalotalea indica TaxID=2867963 RepID=A0AA49JBX8_9BACT|nr:hypothetical protein K4G66_17220 [Tunicatimonas sp. TK19036]